MERNVDILFGKSDQPSRWDQVNVLTSTEPNSLSWTGQAEGGLSMLPGNKRTTYQTSDTQII